ncbi:MAG: hypothetical protein ACM3X6_03400 [Patescibacteria group bacterium]
MELDTTLALLEPLLPPGAKLLDTAAGTGRYAFHFAARGCTVYALDLVPRHVEIMR